MTAQIKSIVFALALLVTSTAFSQGEPIIENQDNAAVYFVRTSGLGAMINFRYFDNGRYIGKFQGANFFKYECEPGKRVLWVKAENIDFVEAELKSGEIYYLEVVPVMGGFSSGVKFRLVDQDDEKQMKRINKVLEKEPKTVTVEEIQEGQAKFADIIQKGMLKIQKKLKKGKKIKYLEIPIVFSD